MKKFISLALALSMVLAMFAGCAAGGSSEATEAPTEIPTGPQLLEGTLEELLNQVVAEQPVEFAAMTMALDLTDTSEDGLLNLEAFTGLKNADSIKEAAVFEPMMGSQAFSMVMVRVADQGVTSEEVAAAMKSGINPRKWICVEADDLMVCGFGDVVMLIMLDSGFGMTAQSFVDAFQKVCAAQYEGAEVTVY